MLHKINSDPIRSKHYREIVTAAQLDLQLMKIMHHCPTHGHSHLIPAQVCYLINRLGKSYDDLFRICRFVIALYYILRIKCK